MTYLQKLAMYHPDWDLKKITEEYCPSYFCMDDPEYCDGESCYKCWQKEIPSENKKEENDTNVQ